MTSYLTVTDLFIRNARRILIELNNLQITNDFSHKKPFFPKRIIVYSANY